MTRLWVPSWQSSTVVLNVTHSPDTTGIHLFVCRSLHTPFLFHNLSCFSFSPLWFVLVNFLDSFHFAHCLTLPFTSPWLFLHWFLPPSCFSSSPVFFFSRAALSSLPFLYPFIFPHRLWAEKFWQSTREPGLPLPPSHLLLPSLPSILMQLAPSLIHLRFKR